MAINTDDIRQLAETVWEATLGIPISVDESGSFGPCGRSTAACVQITGAWSGAVLLDCPEKVARRAAAVIFASAAERVTVSDMQDAIAELANMIAGNIKGLLPEKCFLSLPSVVEGGDYSARVPGSRVANRLNLSCDGQNVSITVLESTHKPAPNGGV